MIDSLSTSTGDCPDVDSSEDASAGTDQMPRLWQRAFEPVPVASLVVFRIWFGAMMALDTFWHIRYGWVEQAYIQPRFLFKFYFFEWVHPWPGNGMYLHFAALLLLAGCIAVGLFYRLATVLFAVGMTYVFLLDKAEYLNHVYLTCLLSWILVFVPCHCAFSLDAIRRPDLRSSAVPAWCLWMVQFQMAVPYFFGGIAKLDPDWLSCDTVTMFFVRESRLETFGPYLAHPLVIQCVTYGGLLFDLLVSPLLLWKRTRVPTFVVAVLFHLTNSQLFNIGIFPWLMIGATTILFSPDWPERILRLNTSDPERISPVEARTRKETLTVVIVGVYILIQVTLPLRQFFYPDPNWTDEGQNFCWRMMLRRKLNESRIVAVDKQTGRRGTIRSEEYLTPRQIRTMSGSPDMLLQFSHFLDRTLCEERGINEIGIHAYVISSLNGRQAQLLVDPEVDLTEKQRSLRHADWIMPLKGPTLSEMRQKAGGAALKSIEQVQRRSTSL